MYKEGYYSYLNVGLKKLRTSSGTVDVLNQCNTIYLRSSKIDFHSVSGKQVYINCYISASDLDVFSLIWLFRQYEIRIRI